MKRNLLNALLLAAAIAGVGQLSSCKDYDEDLRNEWRQTNLTLEEKIAKLDGRLTEVEKLQQACKEDCKKQLEALAARLGVLDGQGGKIDQIMAAIEALKNGFTPDQVTALQNTINNILHNMGYANADGTPIVDLAHINEELSRISLLVANYNQLEADVESLKAFKEGLPEMLRSIAREEATALFEARVAKLETDLGTLSATVNSLKQDVDSNKAAIANIMNQLDSVGQNYTTLVARYNGLESKYNDLSDKYTTLNNTVSTIQTDLSGIKARLSVAEINAINALAKANTNANAIGVLEGLVGGLQGAVNNLESSLFATDSTVAANKALIAANTQEIGVLKGKLESMQSELAELSNKYNTLAGTLSGVNDRVTTIESVLGTLASQADLTALVGRVEANEDQIAALNGRVNQLMKIYDRLNSLITSIEVQRVVNPLFGSFSTPLGIETSILVNYWGQYTGAKDLVFPSHRAVEGTDNMLSASDAQMLEGLFTPETITNNQYLIEDCGLGNVYLTINPNNVNFTGGNLTLESSIGRTSGVELRNVRRCNEELTFGGSRAGYNNGFYIADAYLPGNAQAINKTKLEIVPGLASAVKDVVKERSKSAVFNLMKKVYSQVTVNMPAYGIKAAWKANDGTGEKEYAVFSKYGIAATCFRPLSYNSLAGVSTSRELPIFGTRHQVIEILNDLVPRDSFHFDLGTANINVQGVTFDFQLGEFTLTSDGVNIAVTSPGVHVSMEIDGEMHETTTDPFTINITGSDLQPLMDQLNSQLNQQVNNWNAEMHQAFEDAMNSLVNDLQTQVNDLLNDMEARLNEQVGDLVDEITGDLADRLQPYMNKLNSLLERYNSVAHRINKVLKDPNQYLQVAILYKGASGTPHFLSNDPKDPTYASNAGGNAMTLVATSYTAEIAAPAYRKFVAVSNIIDNTGKSAKGGNATLKAELRQINNGGTLCKVMTGRAKRFALPTGKMKKGYTYEIVYTALDYHGYTSTQHFYLKIK